MILCLAQNVNVHLEFIFVYKRNNNLNHFLEYTFECTSKLTAAQWLILVHFKTPNLDGVSHDRLQRSVSHKISKHYVIIRVCLVLIYNTYF